VRALAPDMRPMLREAAAELLQERAVTVATTGATDAAAIRAATAAAEAAALKPDQIDACAAIQVVGGVLRTSTRPSLNLILYIHLLLPFLLHLLIFPRLDLLLLLLLLLLLSSSVLSARLYEHSP